MGRTPTGPATIGRAALPAACLAALLAGAAAAQVVAVDYGELARRLDGRVRFETLPQRPEPGFNLDAPLREPGVLIGERFAGQTVSGAPHDRLDGAPVAPLRPRPGARGRNLSVAFHRGFGSNALFPLGPAGFPALGARGEGAVAVLFDRDQAAVGLRIHSDYPDPLGGRPPPGAAILRLYARSGRLIARVRLHLAPGVNEIALRREGGIPDIAGFALTNTDPGGIAIDDILFRRTALTG